MILFLASFLAIYTGTHAIVFWGMHPLLSGHLALPSLTWEWMALMILAPVAVRVLDRSGHDLIARALAWVGYSWMGFLFLAFSLFTLLLKHRPRFNEKAAGLFDLQLSGHAHRGQIYPFNYLTALEYPKQDGLYSLPGGGHLYASRGTGTWGPPMRVLSPPEITLFEIVRAEP